MARRGSAPLKRLHQSCILAVRTRGVPSYIPEPTPGSSLARGPVYFAAWSPVLLSNVVPEPRKESWTTPPRIELFRIGRRIIQQLGIGCNDLRHLMVHDFV